MRRGFTLVEALWVLALIGMLSGLAAPRLNGWHDRLAVRRAVAEAAALYQTARFGALFRGTTVRVEFRPDSLLAAYEGVRDSVFLMRPGPARDGVLLTTSRAVTRLFPNGIAAGGANLTMTFRRGSYRESLILSRAGRLRHSR